MATVFLMKYLKKVGGGRWLAVAPMQREPCFEVLYLQRGRPAAGIRVEQREGESERERESLEYLDHADV